MAWNDPLGLRQCLAQGPSQMHRLLTGKRVKFRSTRRARPDPRSQVRLPGPGLLVFSFLTFFQDL